MNVHVVIPAYHEQDSIGRVLRRLSQEVRHPIRVTVVCDSADDPTFRVVDELISELPYSVQKKENMFGRGALNAIKTGLAGTVHGEATVVVMADGCDELALIDAMALQIRHGSDVVCASRYMRGGRQIGGHPVKQLLAKTASQTLHTLIGVPTHDITNSFKMYSHKLLKSVEIESLGGFEVGMELTLKAFRQGLKVCELPTVWVERRVGKSRFLLRTWLPHYARWYWFGLRSRPLHRDQTAE